MASATRIMQPLRKSQAMGPSVRNLLNQYKLDPSQITSTGPHHTLLKSDVLTYLNQRTATNQDKGANPGTTSTAQRSSLSAPKPTSSRSEPADYVMQSSKLYPRRTLTQVEIDVINGGGIADPPPPPPSSSKGAGTQMRKH